MRRHVVWVCCGCDDCEPLDGSEPSGYPCRDSPSSNGAEVVLAEDYDRLRAALELIASPPGLNEDSTPDDWVWGLQGAMKIAREALTAPLPSLRQSGEPS